MDERASVNYARRGKQRVAISIVILPSGKTARARKGAGHVWYRGRLALRERQLRRRPPHHRHAFNIFGSSSARKELLPLSPRGV